MLRKGAAARLAAVVLLLSVPPAGPAHAGPAWRLRVDTSFRTFAFRGVELDSLPVGDAVVGPFGGLQTPDGIAVTCPPGSPYCFFFRPGPEERTNPLTGTADFTAWDLGPRGLSLHLRTRAAGAPDSPSLWSDTSPAVRLQEAYADWTRPSLAVRAGRLRQITRFGSQGWDGGRVEARALHGLLGASAWGGWGLAGPTDLPITNSSLDPLGEFTPAQRPVLFGADLRAAPRWADARLLYERLLDTRADDFVSERVGADVTLRPVTGVTASAGSDWDLAASTWGNAEAALRWQPPRALESVTAGVRRHQPRFDLWYVWTAFSPVAYHAFYAEGATRPLEALRLTLRGESYTYDDTGADAVLFRGEDDGWRWTAEGAWDPDAHWRFRASTHRELGPGAGSKGLEGEAGYDLGAFDVAVSAGWLDRPLELRYDDVTLTTWGLRTSWAARPDLALHADVRTFQEERDRPDAAAFTTDHVSAALSASFLFGSEPRRGALPAAVRAMPPRRVTP